jgi:hypothetical protein
VKPLNGPPEIALAQVMLERVMGLSRAKAAETQVSALAERPLG